MLFLLQATLQIAGGDWSVALKMLEDPDSLMVHPEVKKKLSRMCLGDIFIVFDAVFGCKIVQDVDI